MTTDIDEFATEVIPDDEPVAGVSTVQHDEPEDDEEAGHVDPADDSDLEGIVDTDADD